MAEIQDGTYPELHTTTNGTNGTAAGLKDSIVNSKYHHAQSAVDAVSNHPTVQSIANGPMAQKAKQEVDKTSAQFTNVANARRVPSHQTATGQSLTHYHSLFYNILSWENPRVTGIVYTTIITFIFFSRYVPILKYFCKATYTILGIIAAAEIAGKLVFDKGLATQVRPHKYYTIPRENLEAALEDVEQLVNFFVIEFQRIVFAENVYATVAAFASALVAYFMVKFVPAWGILLTFTTAVFFLPLVYVQNRELIDEHLTTASTVINQQAAQVRDLAAQHTGSASESIKSTVSQYTAKAQDMVAQYQGKAPAATTSTSEVKKEDFPVAPTSAPVTLPSAASHTEHTESVPHAHEETLKAELVL